MSRQPTDQQFRRDKRDEKTLVDASWALRRLTDKRFYHGQGATLYAVCEVLDRAALDISDVNPHVRSCLLRVAQAVVQDARIDAGEDPSKGLV